MTKPHDKAIEAACEEFWVDSWKELHPGTRHKLREMMAKAIAAYERAMWRPKINWEDAEDPIVKLLVQYPVDKFVAEYEYGEDGYVPDEAERALIEDAIYGFITDLHEKMRAALPLPPVPEGE